MTGRPFFTIGHSTRSIDGLAALLHGNGVSRLVDVRTVPRSRANPQFNRDTLPAALAPFGIGYSYIGKLGGLRGRSKTVARDVNGFWENDSFHNYADYTLTPSFAEGLAELLEAGHRECIAIMCAETLWWRCHRRIIADRLLAKGERVFHIMGEGHAEPAELTKGAVVGVDGLVRYPAAQASLTL